MGGECGPHGLPPWKAGQVGWAVAHHVRESWWEVHTSLQRAVGSQGRWAGLPSLSGWRF